MRAEDFGEVSVKVYDGIFGGIFAVGGEHSSYVVDEAHLHEAVDDPADAGIYFYSYDISE